MLDVHLKEHKGSINSIALSPSGDVVASCASDGTCCIWDIESYGKVALLREENNFQDVKFLDTLVVTSGTNGIVRQGLRVDYILGCGEEEGSEEDKWGRGGADYSRFGYQPHEGVHGDCGG